MNTRTKLMVGTVLTVLSGMIAFAPHPHALAQEVDEPPKCVYAAYRAQWGTCWGPTTRLCEGSADCPAPGGN